MIAFSFILLPIIIYRLNFSGELSEKHETWGEFGSYLSGIYGSLALILVAYSTFLTRRQFSRQNEDSIFFNSFEALKKRIESCEIVANDERITSYKCLKFIVECFKEELSQEAVNIARHLLCDNPASINKTQYCKLFQAINGEGFLQTFAEDYENLIKALTESKYATDRQRYNANWEFIKLYISSQGSETAKVREALSGMGSVYFYKIGFEDRRTHYSSVLERINDRYGEFLDGYLRNILFICETTNVSVNRDLYVKYIESQLTRYEIIIIFYMLAGNKTIGYNASTIRELGILKRLRIFDCRSQMIDWPDEKQIEDELSNVFSYQEETSYVERHSGHSS